MSWASPTQSPDQKRNATPTHTTSTEISQSVRISEKYSLLRHDVRKSPEQPGPWLLVCANLTFCAQVASVVLTLLRVTWSSYFSPVPPHPSLIPPSLSPSSESQNSSLNPSQTGTRLRVSGMQLVTFSVSRNQAKPDSDCFQAVSFVSESQNTRQTLIYSHFLCLGLCTWSRYVSDIVLSL